MDGRVQLPVISYLKKRFSADYVDSITEAGPNLILSNGKKDTSLQSILERLKISVQAHNSVGIAVVGHHDCAGNPASKNEQIIQIQNAIKFLRLQYKQIEIIGLWVDANWQVQEVTEDKIR